MSHRGWLTCGIFLLAVAMPAAHGYQTPSAASPDTPLARVHLQQARSVPTQYGGAALSSSAQPLVLTSGDFDGDGVPDLISGYATSNGGAITLHRGNINALWPYGAALRNGPPEPFLPNAQVFALPMAPDFIVTGDFDADGHWDVVAGQRGSDSLYFLRGDGHGGFRKPERVSLGGALTGLIAGDINHADGLIDLIVTVDSADGPRALVYESPLGAIKAQPEIFTLPGSATALALGRFHGGVMNDLAIATGNRLVVIEGRDRMLSASDEARPAVPTAKISVQPMSYSITALVAGDFTGTGPSIAALGNDGNVHVLEHVMTQSIFSPKALADPNFQPTFQVAPSSSGEKPAAMGGHLTPFAAAQLNAVRQGLQQNSSSAEWIERSVVSLPSGFGQANPRLLAARVTGSLHEDILTVDTVNAKLHVLSTSTLSSALHSSANTQERNEAQSALQKPASMKLLTSLETISAPAAVLPMRLNQHGLSGLVLLQAGQTAPMFLPHIADNTFVVTNTLDGIPTTFQGPGPAGSLREAMIEAQAAGGTSEIDFNIPTSDPGYNAATGTFVIKPLSEAPPGALNDFALPPIDNTVTIDGYTQPGASPNTLANGDNAKLLIQIDGSLATTPGGSGLSPFDDTGSVYRGLIFTGWITPEITSGSSGSTASGAEGIEAGGVSDFIEGNFFGTDPTGTKAMPNRIGIFADAGPGFGSSNGGNIIGGTTPQARNILSGNNNSGILFLSTAYEAQLQGNFVGLDVTGKAIVSNPQEANRSNTFDGVGLNGPTVTIGGTLSGSANVIAGNGTNVDINDLTEGNAANNSFVLGNLIGTDSTGTQAIANQGYGVSILHNPTHMTIGGSTPAARNVISGNLIGVYVFDNSLYNVVQGNYIGTDITGTVAVPNVGQGFISGSTSTTEPPAAGTIIGGTVLGARNVISGNTLDGIQISGAYSSSPGFTPYIGSTIQGNLIGTDPTGTKSLPNHGNGISILSGGTNNTIGGTGSGLGNVIANNALNGVLIDPGTANGPGVNNVTTANNIFSNTGAGVRVKSGTANRISANSIYNNASLGIDIDAAGPGTNTHCNATNGGANMLQNYPVLTAGTGTTYISATATDPNGNTSEFSKAVKANVSGNILSLLGSFDSLPSTTFTLEFFSSTTPDASGFGQGQTYLTSATIKTAADCTYTITQPIDTTQADVAVTLTSNTSTADIGPDFGNSYYTGTVINNGPATAHNVVFTDTLPAGVIVSNAYCNVASCQSPITTTLGTCTVSGQTITCNLGAMAPAASAVITIPYQLTAPGALSNTATVAATEVDPNLTNNTATVKVNSTYNYPFFDHFSVKSSLVSSSPLPLIIYGEGFGPYSTVTFAGTALPVQGIYDNQLCGSVFNPEICTGLAVTVPPSLLAAAGTPTVVISNPDPGPGGSSNFSTSANFTIVASCVYTADFFGFLPLDAEGDTLIPEEVEITTNAPNCPWTAASNVPWATILDNSSGTNSGTFDVWISPNNTTADRSGTITVAGQTVALTQSHDTTVCVYSAPGSQNVPVNGGNETAAVTTGSSCSYFNETYAPWITIPQTSGLLVGSGTVSYTVAPNFGPPRTGTISLGGAVLTVSQASQSCYFTLNTTTGTAPVSGTTGSLAVTASSSSCAWTATSSDTTHLAVTSGASGTGNGTVNYTVPANTAGPQTPTITVGNSTANAIFTMTQASAFTCTFTVTPTPYAVGVNGTSNFITITASYSFCKWTAVSNNPSALTIQNSSGTGSGAVYYTVGINSGAARTITITAGCQTFTINQDGTNSNPVPVITSLSPSTAVAGSAAFTLTVNGTNFINGSAVNFNGVARATTYVSASQLTAAILASDIATPGTPGVTVTSPTPGGGTSNSLPFTVTGANNPVPAITSLSPSTAAAGSSAFTLTVNGSNFVNGSVVNFNGVARTTTYVSATQLTAAILASDIATAGTPAVTVVNPTPGGGTSNSLTFTVTATNPVPVITALNPSTATAGSAAFTLTVTGSGFVNGSVVNFNGAARATTYVSATQLTAAILASDITTAGTPAVTVTSPTPGGGTSNSLTFTVTATNPVPVITALNPSTAAAGSAAFTLTVSGSGFVNGSVVTFNGAARATTYVSATQLTAAILASDITTAGTPAVTVTSPTPGGGTSNSLTFTVTAANNPVPVITALNPATIAVGSAGFTLTVSGTNFVNGAVVKFNGTARTTAFVSATQVTAGITASDIATAGTPVVTVTNPTPGGGASNAVTFTITAPSNPAPTITALQPTHSAAGAGFNLTVNGASFLASSTVSFNGKTETTTYISATQLTAAIPTADATGAGTVQVSVTNPAPGGGTSPTSAFTLDDYSVSGPASAVSITRGGPSVQITFTVTPTANGYANPVTFSVSGLATGLTGSFSQPTVTPGSSAATTTLTITAARLAELQRPALPSRFPSAPVIAFALGLPGLLLIRKRTRRVLLRRGISLALCLIALSGIGVALSGCNGGFTLNTVSSNAITVTAASGTDQHTTPVTLTIQ